MTMAPPPHTLTPGTLSLLERLIQHSGGREVCGWVAVNRRGEQRFVLLRNLAERGSSFIVDEMEIDRVSRHMESAGWRPSAFLHTHQHSTQLSGADRASLATSRWPWIIVVPRASGFDVAIYQPGKEAAETFPA
jgi:proteasome lid subunit RPN8/RPN11